MFIPVFVVNFFAESAAVLTQGRHQQGLVSDTGPVRRIPTLLANRDWVAVFYTHFIYLTNLKSS
jgi:hypothetical protein